MKEEFPYLMHKRTFAYEPNTPGVARIFGDQGIAITKAQAAALCREGKKAGVEILRAAVARDNAAALAEAEAENAARPAEHVPPKEAPDVEADTPWYINKGEAKAEAAAEVPSAPEDTAPATVTQTVGANQYEGRSLEEMRAIAAENGIDGSKMSRRQIIAALTAKSEA